MPYNNSIIGNLFQGVDQYGSAWVASTYHHLATSYGSLLYLFSAIYLGFVFLEIQRGAREGRDFIFVIVRMVAILTVALNYDYFYLFVYNVFTNGPLYLCKAITLSGSNHIEPLKISDALDQFLKEGLLESNTLFSMGSWTNLNYALFGSFLFLATLISVAIATALIFLAKIASAVILALSPLFIFFALFESTEGWFNSYLQHLFTYALIPIVTSAVLMIVLSVSTSTIEYMHSDTPAFKLLVPFFIACLVQIWLFLQVPQKCASLASGFNLKGVFSSFSETKANFQTFKDTLKGGVAMTRTLTSFGSQVAQLMGKGGASAKEYLKNRMNRFTKVD
ncbi:MAG: virB6 [Gammaproteobacteria bacterium]|jgi:type IV secretion system protein VirB6|nr:virB6 [Gammaproteobacteria bacterium]